MHAPAAPRSEPSPKHVSGGSARDLRKSPRRRTRGRSGLVEVKDAKGDPDDGVFDEEEEAATERLQV